MSKTGWSNFWKSIMDLKIPSIVIVAIFSYFSFSFLNSKPSFSSTSGVAGLAFLISAILLGIYSFMSSIIGEHYKKIIDIQYEAMRNIGRTHSIYEENAQLNITQQSNEIASGEYLQNDATEIGTST